MYLIDTMVLSEGSKGHPNAEVMGWLAGIRFEDAFVSVITLGEIQRGIRKAELRDSYRADRHKVWLEKTLIEYRGRVLRVTTAIARRWGTLTYDMRNASGDLLIAATALEHDLTVVTRNTRHFEPTGAKLLNPYET